MSHEPIPDWDKGVEAIAAAFEAMKKCPKCRHPLNVDGACVLDGDEFHDRGGWAWDEEMEIWLNREAGRTKNKTGHETTRIL